MNDLVSYLGNGKILIADTNSVARAAMANILISMGVKTAQIVTAASYAQAEQEIARIRPRVLICDYDLGRRCGLDLLQAQRQADPDSKDALFVLVTGNATQTAVAKAAEEDVDTFILKPFTVEGLRSSINRAVALKLHPTEYLMTIEKGKSELVAGNIDSAIRIFNQASALDPSPALACFYLGQSQLIRKALSAAQNNYLQGLQYNQIHYKCMVGLFDVLVAKHRNDEAYDVVKRIARFFPANPERITAVFRLAILTQNYEDIESYYEIFTSIEARNDEMNKYVCAALVVCGKHFLREGQLERALGLFQNAATTAHRRVSVTREIIMTLSEHGLHDSAKNFLKKFPPETRAQIDFLAMDYLVRDQFETPAKMIDRGRELVSKGFHDPVIYKILIRRSLEAGLDHAADELIRNANARWTQHGHVFSAIREAREAETGLIQSE